MTEISNDLSISLYEQFSTTAVDDSAGDLSRATIEYYETQYPNGLYGAASFNIPRDVTHSFQFRGGNRLVIRNGLEIVYEGELLNPTFNVDVIDQAIGVEAAGFYGTLLNRHTLDKPWADGRITQGVWVFDETTSAGDKCAIDRHDRLKLIPQNVSWTNGEYAQVVYTAPTGQTISKITYDYKLAESAQAWEIDLYDATNGSHSLATTSSTGTGQTYSPATPQQTIAFRMIARATQTPNGNNDHIGKLHNITVYTETSNINLYEIALDILAANPNLNSDETNIDTGATLAINPFITDGPKTHAAILNQAAAFGDSSQNSYATYVRESDFAGTPDGKPVLVLEQYPALTSFDYAVRLDEANMATPFRLIWDFQAIANWIIVEYRDENGTKKFITPDDSSSLTDATSVADWGHRELTQPLNAGTTTSVRAVDLGERYLARYKDPRFSVSGPIRVTGWIRGSGGERIPAARIKAGTVLKIENFLDDLTAETGAGLSFLVTRTRYNPGTETCEIYTGDAPDDLGLLLAQMQAGII